MITLEQSSKNQIIYRTDADSKGDCISFVDVNISSNLFLATTHLGLSVGWFLHFVLGNNHYI